MRADHNFYGWHDPRRGFLISRYPPDAPVRPAVAYDSAEEAVAAVKRSRRLAKVLWIPALPKGLVSHADQQ